MIYYDLRKTLMLKSWSKPTLPKPERFQSVLLLIRGPYCHGHSFFIVKGPPSILLKSLLVLRIEVLRMFLKLRFLNLRYSADFRRSRLVSITSRFRKCVEYFGVEFSCVEFSVLALCKIFWCWVCRTQLVSPCCCQYSCCPCCCYIAELKYSYRISSELLK